MAREFRGSITVALPDGVMEEAEALMKLKPAVDTFTAAIKAQGGEFEIEVVVPKPREGKKSEGAV